MNLAADKTILPPRPTTPPPPVPLAPFKPETSTWRAIEQTAVETVKPARRGT